MTDTALSQLARYFDVTPIQLMVAIVAIAVVVIVAVGYACVELSMAPEKERSRYELSHRDLRFGQAWLLSTPIAIIALWYVVTLVWR